MTPRYDEAVRLHDWAAKMKGKKPDYIALSLQGRLDIERELGSDGSGGQITRIYGMKVITLHGVSSNFMQVGYGPV